MIRVLLVDDSPIALHVLQRLLLKAPDIEVIGTASNGMEALDLLSSLKPDVISTDLHMPKMNGLELTRVVMTSHPCPILVVSVSVEPGSPNVFHLLEAGAVDVYAKPQDILESDHEKLARELASKIRIVAGVHVFHTPKTAIPSSAPYSLPKPVLRPTMPAKLIVIGASTGGPQALRTILSSLPKSFPLPIIAIQHIGADFLDEMLHWLSEVCSLPISKASQNQAPQGGHIYFAPGEVHLELDTFDRFVLSDSAPYDGHRPSVTVTMRAVARRFGANAVGVLLTGMGRDGAEGLADIMAAGGITIAQDEASSVVYGMPQAAATLGAAKHILALEQIAPTLVALVKPDDSPSRILNTKEAT